MRATKKQKMERDKHMGASLLFAHTTKTTTTTTTTTTTKLEQMRKQSKQNSHSFVQSFHTLTTADDQNKFIENIIKNIEPPKGAAA